MPFPSLLPYVVYNTWYSVQRLPPWYVLLKVCLPSTIGLVKEPQLLDEMYSRSALEIPPPSSSNKNKRISPVSFIIRGIRGLPVWRIPSMSAIMRDREEGRFFDLLLGETQKQFHASNNITVKCIIPNKCLTD